MNALNLMFGREHPNWETAAKEAAALKDAGAYCTRFDCWWGVIQPEKGKWDWSYTDKMAEFFKANDIEALPIFCYSSSWYKKPPDNPEERALFAEYVYQTVNRYKDTYHVWEVWNEPNINQFWPHPDVKNYTLLLKEGYKAAKKADPTCTIVAAATSMPDLTFIRGIHENGGWDYCDAISIHPYSVLGSPIDQKLDRILRITNGYIASTGKPKQLWITEMGWVAGTPDWLEPQAIYMFQSYVISMANGVKKLYWFDLNDWAEKWGICKTSDPLEPKPAYGTYRLMTQYFGSPGPAAKFEGYLKTPDGVACYVFKRPNRERMLVLWASADETIQLAQKDGLKGVDIFGRTVEITDGKVTADRVPIIITGARISQIGKVSPAFNPYVEQKGENLINNGTMERIHGQQPSWWEFGRYDQSAKHGKGELSNEGRNGSRCVAISASGAPTAWDSSPYPIESGKKYRLTVWVKTGEATGSTQIALFWCNGNLQEYAGDVRSQPISGTQDWTEVTVSGIAPKDATFVRVNLISENNTGTAWFDDVTLTAE